MTTGPTHEDPLLVLLPRAADAGAEIQAFLEHPLVRHYAMPPMWTLDRADVDLPDACPDLKSITVDNLPEVLDALTRLCDETALDQLVWKTWRRVDEMVRDFYLQRNTLQTFAAIFKLSSKSVDVEPPAQFRTDRIHDHGFEVQYRLAGRGDLEASFLAPPEEGSLVYYPFDPDNAGGRAEGRIDAADGILLEAFAYEPARALHRAALEDIGAQRGWTILDPHEPQF